MRFQTFTKKNISMSWKLMPSGWCTWLQFSSKAAGLILTSIMIMQFFSALSLVRSSCSNRKKTATWLDHNQKQLDFWLRLDPGATLISCSCQKWVPHPDWLWLTATGHNCILNTNRSSYILKCCTKIGIFYMHHSLAYYCPKHRSHTTPMSHVHDHHTCNMCC